MWYPPFVFMKSGKVWIRTTNLKNFGSVRCFAV